MCDAGPHKPVLRCSLMRTPLCIAISLLVAGCTRLNPGFLDDDQSGGEDGADAGSGADGDGGEGNEDGEGEGGESGGGEQGETDRDDDGVPDSRDNCPDRPNPDQQDQDEDGIGDACDACADDPGNDADEDGVCAAVDRCPDHPNDNDLTAETDPLNCGECGHHCLGGMCEDGSCQPAVLPEGGNAPVDVAVGEEGLVWISRGTEDFGFLDGSAYILRWGEETPTMLASGQAHPERITMRRKQVAWTNLFSGELMVASSDAAGPAFALVEGLFEPRGITTHSSAFFWVTQGGVWTKPFGSQVEAPLAEGRYEAERIVVTDNYILWTESAGDGLYRLPLGAAPDTEPLQLAAISEAMGLAVDETHAYVADNNSGLVMKVDVFDGDHAEIISGLFSPFDIVVDDQHLFFTDSTGGVVYCSEKDGGDLKEVGYSTNPMGMAQTERGVYWADPVDGSVFVVAK